MTDQIPLRVAFHTLGCRLNQYDTEGIKAAMLAERPVEIVAWSEAADLYVLNSCTVTAKADQECRRLARQVKRRQPRSKVVVAGCYAQTQPSELAAMPEIDGIVGNTAKDRVADWLPPVLDASAGPVLAVEEFGKRPEFDSPLIAGFEGRSRAFVKIQDGCDLRCAYCLIWQARGPGRSRPRPLVREQVRRLHAEGGYHELVLTGVHMGSYGRDLPGGPENLLALLATLAEEFPNLRLRLSSIHPNEVTPELLQLIVARPQLRPHLHISLQSGSDAVLRRMRRPYRAETAWNAVAAASAADPAFGIGADVIVGFPGESDAEFAETYGLVESLPFTYLHVFRFSPRPGTPAAGMPHQVHPETVTERAASLRELAAAKRECFHRALVGQPREAVVESADSARPGWRQATTDNYATVIVPANSAAGTLVRILPTAWREGRLEARSLEVLLEANA